jgi:hypothetical protein
MTTNMSMFDRVVRLVLAAVVAALYFTNFITGTWAIVLGIVAVALALTALVGYCPIYALVGFSTKERTLSGR